MPLGLTTYYNNRVVLITGAGGFVGRHLAASLQMLGAHVIAMVRSPVDLPYKTVLANLEDYYSIEGMIAESGPDAIFHLGAQTQVTVAQRAPLHTFEANIRGTYHILEASRRLNVSKVLVASSDKAYGSSDSLPYQEEHPLKGSFPYDVSKTCADLLAQSYFASYGLPVVITRCANLFGPGDRHRHRLIPSTIRAFLNKRAPQLRSNGLARRDYLYISDAVEGLLLALAHGIPGEAYNFGTGLSLSALDVVHEIAQFFQVQSEPNLATGPLSEIDSQALCSNKAAHAFGWSPKIAFATGLSQTVDWFHTQIGSLVEKVL